MIRASLVPVTRRPLRPITLDDAARIYPDSAYLQSKWLAAVCWLRRGRGPGWVLDGSIYRKGS